MILLAACWTATTAAGDSTLGRSDRINLADFARVVWFEGDSAETLEAHELERGPDGWIAWRQGEGKGKSADKGEGKGKGDEEGEDEGQGQAQGQGTGGPYMLGVEWDEPRDVAEVNVEFRHAIANRSKIQVQYFQNHWPSAQAGGWAPLDDPFHGQWVTAKSQWWAGDRDVTFVFLPYNQEQPGPSAPAMRYRRTYRLRILCGTREPPPVRYLQVYGPNPHAEATFDIRFDTASAFKPPVMVWALNGYLLSEVAGTTLPAARLDETPASAQVRFAQGDLETPTRTIVTVRDANDDTQGFSFLPAEVVAHGLIRIPSLGVVVAHRGSTKDLQAGVRPGASVFDRVEREPEQTFERARREVPELKKSPHRPVGFYYPLGPPEARQEIAVRYDGSIYLDQTALKVRAEDSDRLAWPDRCWLIGLSTTDAQFDQKAEGVVKQRLLDGYLPIVISTWEHAGVAYEQTCVATFLAGEPKEVRGDETVVLLSRLVMTNKTSQPAEGSVVLRTEPAEQLTLDHGHVQAVGKIEKDKAQPYDRPRYRFCVVSDSGDGFSLAPSPAGPAQVVQWQRELPAGARCAVQWFVPFVTIGADAEREQIRTLHFDEVLHYETDRWRRLIAQAATIEVPDPLLNDFYKAQLAHILITADRDPYNGMLLLPAGTYGYKVCINESCHQIRSLELRGLHEPARRALEAFIAGQSTLGLDGRFKDKTGALHGLPSKYDNYQGFKYNLDHGFALWMLNEHYRFTRDRDWLARVADALVAACDFVTRERNTAAEANTLGKDDDFWGAGLLPPGHLEDPPEWLWWYAVNAYALRGMRDTARSLAEISHPAAVRIAKDAEAFGEHLRRSCKESMIRAPVVRLRDGTYIPYQPTRSRLRGRDLGWIRDSLYGPVHLIDCGIYADDSPEATWILRDAEDNVFIDGQRGRSLKDFEQQWFSWGGITEQSNLLPNPLVYLRRGQAKHAIRAFYNSLAANVYADMRTFCEMPLGNGSFGGGPFFKTPDESAFIVWLRHLLIMETGNNLDLLAGVPLAWFEPGKQIEVRGAATWFGPLDLDLTCTSDPRQISINLAAPRRNPPEAIRLHLRRPELVRALTVNSQPATTFDATKRILALPGSVDRAQIVVSY